MNQKEIDLLNSINLDYAIAEQNAQDAYDYYTYIFLCGEKGMSFKIFNN